MRLFPPSRQFGAACLVAAAISRPAAAQQAPMDMAMPAAPAPMAMPMPMTSAFGSFSMTREGSGTS